MATTVADYRLGDVFFRHAEVPHIQRERSKYRGTIAGDLLSLPTYNSSWGKHFPVQILSNISQRQCTKYAIPKYNGVAIHLRVGDVACGNIGHERSKRPFPIECYRRWRGTHPRIFATPFYVVNGTQCLEESGAYANRVASYVLGELMPFNKSADYDFCQMRAARIFVAGMGFFSRTIAMLREYENRTTYSLQHGACSKVRYFGVRVRPN